MRIISKFHDYYDTALSYGADDTLVYVRHTTEIPEKEVDSAVSNILTDICKIGVGDLRFKKGREYISLNIKLNALCVCGKKYPVFCIGYSKSFRPLTTYSDFQSQYFKYDYFSDLNSAIARCNELTGVDFSTYKGDSAYVYLRGGPFTKIKTSIMSTLLELFEKTNTSQIDTLHQVYNMPVIYLDSFNKKVVLNPRLMDFGFQKIIDPWTLFQEISMYTGGVLRRQDPGMCNISDKDRIAQHGFDKWSFRKMPDVG